MPYSDISELPEQVRKVLAEDAQELFLAAFNAAYAREANESWARSRAWEAVGKQYTKGSDGTWGAIIDVSFKAPGRLFISNAEHVNAKHDTILQTLDRKIGDCVFDSKWFAPTVDAWSKVPVIYAQEHPNLDAWTEDPEAELKRIKGRLVNGAFKAPSIAVAGHPRLMATGDFKDKEIDEKISNGMISLSTAFWATEKDGHLAAPIEPHHVLLFDETEKDLPRDPGTGFLNKVGDMDEKMRADVQEGLTFLNKAKERLAGLFGPPQEKESDMNDKEYEQKLASAAEEHKTNLAAKDAELAKRDEAVKNKDAEIAKLNTELADFRQKQRDADWEAVKNTLPQGMVHKDAEIESRKLFEENPRAFYEKVLAFKKKPETNAEGAEHSGEGMGKPRRVGRYDPMTQKWVED